MPTWRSAADLAWPDLVWSHFSRPRFDDLDARIEAAAAAGFAAVGLYTEAWNRERARGRTLGELRNRLDGHGITIGEVEVVRGWWATEGPVHAESGRVEALAYELADAIGVRYLQVIGPHECGVAQAIDGFAALCDRAAEHGLLVGIEWLPYTNIATAADAQAIVVGAGRPNGGYCVDIWHHRRGADDASMLAALEPERIFAVQMSDGALQPDLADYKADCLASRVPPGHGEFDCAGFVRMLTGMGVTAPVSVELCSAELWAAPVEVAAARAADAMRAVLADALESPS